MLYRRALGAEFDRLAPALQKFHSVTAEHKFSGRAEIFQGVRLARLAAGVARFPKLEGDVPIQLSVTRDGETEVWSRLFGDHATRSVQWLLRPGIIAERVGPATILMQPRVEEGHLRMPIIGMRGFGVPLPAPLVATGGGVERVEASGEILFDVSARAVGVGLLISYKGALAPATE